MIASAEPNLRFVSKMFVLVSRKDAKGAQRRKEEIVWVVLCAFAALLCGFA
jgi:hypothetical protein